MKKFLSATLVSALLIIAPGPLTTRAAAQVSTVGSRVAPLTSALRVNGSVPQVNAVAPTTIFGLANVPTLTAFQAAPQLLKPIATIGDPAAMATFLQPNRAPNGDTAILNHLFDNAMKELPVAVGSVLGRTSVALQRSLANSDAVNNADPVVLPNSADELMEMLANAASLKKNINPAVFAARAERHGVDEASMRERIADIIKMYPLLEARRAANTTLRELFDKDNPAYKLLLSEETHKSWLGDESKKKYYTPYTQKVHAFLQDLIDKKVAGLEGLEILLTPGTAALDHAVMKDDLFNNFKKKHKWEKKNFATDRLTAPQLQTLKLTFGEAAGRDFDSGFLINTVGGEWNELQGITVKDAYADAWKKGRPGMLYGLQADNVGSNLRALNSRRVLDMLTNAHNKKQMLEAIAEMTRIINVGWRLNNPWYGFGYKLQYRSFHPELEAGGIGIEEIRKDAVTLKATLELIENNQDINLAPDVRAALNKAFANGLDGALKDAVAQDGKALSSAILRTMPKPVQLTDDRSNILEYLTWIFSDRRLIANHLNQLSLEVLEGLYDAKGRADVVRNIERSKIMLEFLFSLQDANSAAHTALAPKIPRKVLQTMARDSHASMLKREERALGLRYVEYTQSLQNLLTAALNAGAEITPLGMSTPLSAKRFTKPQERYRITVDSFERRTPRQRDALREFLAAFQSLKGKPFANADLEPQAEIYTLSAEWNTLLAMGLGDRQWTAAREGYLYALQSSAFTPVFTALFDEPLLKLLESQNEAEREDALFKIMRRIDLNTRLDHADRGWSRLSRPYDLDKDKLGGVGIEAIRQDALMLESFLETILTNVDLLTLDPGRVARIKKAVSSKLLASARALTNTEYLVKVVERNRIKEKHTLATLGPVAP